jgi:hypothetical protein
MLPALTNVTTIVPPGEDIAVGTDKGVVVETTPVCGTHADNESDRSQIEIRT